jgi:IMP cyclohydrolase
MYVGRIVAVGMNLKGKLAAIYRVSSRSFPNRKSVVRGNVASIVPKEGHETDIHKNPYIAYNCLKIAGNVAVATNGSQTDPIAEKIASGMSIRDAMIVSMMVLDYEKDDYNTPRIASAVDLETRSGWLGIARHDGLNVRQLPLEPGNAFYIATYETNDVVLSQTETFEVQNAGEACNYIMEFGVFGTMTNAVSSVCAFEVDGEFEIALGPEK